MIKKKKNEEIRESKEPLVLDEPEEEERHPPENWCNCPACQKARGERVTRPFVSTTPPEPERKSKIITTRDLPSDLSKTRTEREEK